MRQKCKMKTAARPGVAAFSYRAVMNCAATCLACSGLIASARIMFLLTRSTMLSSKTKSLYLFISMPFFRLQRYEIFLRYAKNIHYYKKNGKNDKKIW